MVIDQLPPLLLLLDHQEEMQMGLQAVPVHRYPIQESVYLDQRMQVEVEFAREFDQGSLGRKGLRMGLLLQHQLQKG
jgi:hypothetical protein